MRDTIFISYSHVDGDWLRRFENGLKVDVLREAYNTWSDRQILPGQEWDPTIETMISAAKIALLLVSPDFLQSDYIATKELPKILDRYKQGGIDVFWVPIRFVTDVRLDIAGLHKIQALWPTNQPLADLPPADCQKAIDTISDQLIKSLGVPGETTSKAIENLRNDLKAALGNDYVLGERIAFGDISIVYKAQRHRRDVAVKVVLPSTRRQWIAADFIARANRFQEIGDHFFIKILDTISKDHVCAAVMELVDLPKLRDVIKQSDEPGMKPADVADILAQVALAASHVHEESTGREEDQNPLLVGALRPSHIYVYRNPGGRRIKISPVQMSDATLQSCHARPMVTLGDDELTWLTPERYRGERMQPATDQYYVALLGLELLTGSPPVPVNSYADLERKREFFEAPLARLAEQRKAAPALFFVLARMLEPRPEDRWPSMAQAYAPLRQVADGVLPDDLRRRARDDYPKLLADEFYYKFYSELFRISPDTRKLFDKTDMEEQRRKLHGAIGVLMNFRRDDHPNPMARYVESHHEMELQPEYFDAFRDAFLTALTQLTIKVDSYAVDAWRAILDAGIAYMTQSVRPADVTVN